MKRILVIEDEPAINELICMNLEIAGYEPVAFLDGAEFSRHLKQEDGYDLALLDIMLPGKDGFALLEELKEHGIPVIYLTAKGDLPKKQELQTVIQEPQTVELKVEKEEP